ncbi:MAG: tetratricopeptide repeat protein [Bacteroidota bacterium]
MADDLRTQIYNNLIIKDTAELLEIWQSGDTTAWNQDVFEIIRTILLERLGSVPHPSNQVQVLHLLENAERDLEDGELDKALSGLELAIQIDPNSAPAYNSRGVIFEEMGQPENAIASYQRAIQLDPSLKDAWDNLIGIEAELEKAFEGSSAKQHLDQALELAYNDEPEPALEECESARQSLPRIAIAYNYLGLILETLDRLEPAIDAYLTAIQLNPRFYTARENLANARVRLEEDQYLGMSSLELEKTGTEFYETLYMKTLEPGMPIPGWAYLDANAFLLRGWAGHRTRPGRTGYDPLDRDFEFAHVEGVILRRLFTGRFRTRNPVYLLIMACMGISYLVPGLWLLGIRDWLQLMGEVMYIPYLGIGVALLVNVYLSLRAGKPDEDKDQGFTFF